MGGFGDKWAFFDINHSQGLFPFCGWVFPRQRPDLFLFPLRFMFSPAGRWDKIHSYHHWAKHPLSRNTYDDHWLDNMGNAVVGHFCAQAPPTGPVGLCVRRKNLFSGDSLWRLGNHCLCLGCGGRAMITLGFVRVSTGKLKRSFQSARVPFNPWCL